MLNLNKFYQLYVSFFVFYEFIVIGVLLLSLYILTSKDVKNELSQKKCKLTNFLNLDM